MPKRTLTDYDLDLIDQVFDARLEEKVEAVVEKTVKKHVGNLPSKDYFDKRMDELVTEIKAEREENTILDNRSKRNRDRIENIESHLNLTTPIE